MSKKEDRKLEKLYFIKSPVGYGYHAEQVEDVPAELAKEFKQAGIARPATQTLPEDLPGRAAFMEAGIESLDEIEELDDLTSVKGIGESTAEEIVEWFKENQ